MVFINKAITNRVLIFKMPESCFWCPFFNGGNTAGSCNLLHKNVHDIHDQVDKDCPFLQDKVVEI